MTGRHLAYPFRIGADGRAEAPSSPADHLRGEIIQLLLTNQGERPFLPSFGGGLRRLVFERNDDVTAGLTKARLTQALGHWLGHRLEVQHLSVDAEGAALIVDLRYRVLGTGESRRLQFRHGDEG